MPLPDFPAASLGRALVIKLRHHGDVLLSAPVISSLKRAAPDCEVDALIYADTAPMLAGHPGVSRLHLIDRDWKRQGLWRQGHAELGLLRRLRARRYDLVVHLSTHTRGAWLTRLLRPRWSVAPAFRQGFWERSFTHLYPAQSNPQRHTVESNLDSLRALGMGEGQLDKRVQLVPGAEAGAAVERMLAEHGIAVGGFVHCHPASRWGFKCWPAQKVAQLCSQINAEGLPVILTAAPEPREQALVAAVIAAQAESGPAAASGTVAPALTFDFAGRLALKELAALTARARLFVGVDSAPMHMAAAMGTPTVAIFGPSGDREWGPWNVASRVVASDQHAHCRPCGRAGCNDSKISECLTTLPVAQVKQACAELLA